MKIRRTRIIVFVVVVVAMILVAFKLSSNRSKFKNEIAIAQQKADKVAVSADSVTYGTIKQDVSATGALEASQVLTLVSETQGRIVKIFKKKGDRVSTGEVIVKVDDEVIAANVLTAEANYVQYEKDVERLTRLAEENAVTKRDLEQATIGLKKAKADLINARKALNNTSIKAPISGYINNDFITEGQLLAGGTQVCEIVNNSKLNLNIKVSEYEVYKIKVGQEVMLHLSVFPDKTFTGKITSIAEKADAAMKFNVEITLENDSDAHLKSGLYAEAVLPIKSEEKLVIRKDAIVGSMEKPEVFVVKNGKAEKREIIIGQGNDNQVEVLRGLSVGDILIVSGQLNIKGGDEVNIVE